MTHVKAREPGESLLEQYDDPDPEALAVKLAAAQRDASEGWTMFDTPALQRAAIRLTRAGVFSAAKARDIRLAPRGRAYRVVQ